MSSSANPERSAANGSSRAFWAACAFFLSFAAVIVGLVLGWELESGAPPPDLGGLENWTKAEWGRHRRHRRRGGGGGPAYLRGSA